MVRERKMLPEQEGRQKVTGKLSTRMRTCRVSPHFLRLYNPIHLQFSFHLPRTSIDIMSEVKIVAVVSILERWWRDRKIPNMPCVMNFPCFRTQRSLPNSRVQSSPSMSEIHWLNWQSECKSSRYDSSERNEALLMSHDVSWGHWPPEVSNNHY